MRLLILPLAALSALLLSIATPLFASTYTVDVQIITVCSDDGSYCTPVNVDEDAINDIFAPAGISLTFLPVIELHDTDYLNLSPTAAQALIQTERPGATANKVEPPVQIWLTNIDFQPLLSLQGTNGIIASYRTTSGVFPEAEMSRMLAHGLGHTFGLVHPADMTVPNLMGYGGTSLTPEQIATLQSSPFLTEVPAVVPLPAGAALLGGGLVMLGAAARKRERAQLGKMSLDRA